MLDNTLILFLCNLNSHMEFEKGVFTEFKSEEHYTESESSRLIDMVLLEVIGRN